MGRLRGVVLGLLMSACQSSQDSPARASGKPELPERILAGTSRCEWCVEDREQACTFEMRHACPDGEGTCASVIPCDPACCPAPQAQQLGLEQPPWGPTLEAEAADERPPTGVIAYHRGADLVLLRPGVVTDRPTPLLRLPQPIHAWRWSAAQRQIIYAAGAHRHLHGFDIARRTGVGLPNAPVAAATFDVTPNGERAVLVPRSGMNELLLLELGDGSQERWRFELGEVQAPAWDPLGTRVALTLMLGPNNRVRIADPSARTIVDSVRDLPELSRPVWHPSGRFLAAWRVDGERCVLALLDPDGVHHAATSLALERSDCPPIAFSPDGRHLALLLRSESYEDNKIELLKLSSPGERQLLTQSAGPVDSILWLDDEAAAALAELAGFVAPCEACYAEPVEPRRPIAARPLDELAFASLVAELDGQPRPAGLLAYVALVDGTRQIHAIAPQGGKAQVLTDAKAGAEGPVFSPDGRGLAFVSADRKQLAVIDLAEQHVYKPWIRTRLRLGVPEWSHDGASLLTAGTQLDRDPPQTTLYAFEFAYDHWGTVWTTSTTLPGSLDARPSRGPSGLLAHGQHGALDRLTFTESRTEPVANFGPRLPRMIAPSWHPSGRFFAAWVGAAGHYELAWVDANADAWAATGVRYRAIGEAAHVAEPAPIAFAPTGSHFAFARPDPTNGGMTIEVAAIGDPLATTIVVRTDAGVGHLAWSVPAAVSHVAAAKLPYAWDKPAPKAFKPEPSYGPELDTSIVECRRAHPVALGADVHLHSTSLGATGEITEALVTGELEGTAFAKCLEQGVKRVGFDPFEREQYRSVYHFRVAEHGVGPVFE